MQSAGADYQQARTTKQYLAEMTKEGISTKLSNNFKRARQGTSNLLSDLMGFEGAQSGYWRDVVNDFGNKRRQRVFGTMSVGIASIGFVANANGADISVEVIKKTKSRTILPPSAGTTKYLIRLWLCQPPLEIYGKLAGHVESDDVKAYNEAYASNVFIGGEREIAIASA